MNPIPPFVSFDLEPAIAERLASTWTFSQASYPEEGVYFLQEAYLRQMIELTGLRMPAQEPFLACAAQIRQNDALSRLAWHCHWLLDVAPSEFRQVSVPWSIEPDGCRFFPAFIALARYPFIHAFYQERAIPLNILQESMTVVDVWTQDYYDHTGQWGCFREWIRMPMVPNLFRLGRLESEFGNFTVPFRVYRHRETGQTAVMVAEGLSLQAAGFFCQPDESQVVMTTFEESAQQVTGYAATPTGRLSLQKTTLSLEEWELACKPGDAAIHVHIPALAPLDHDRCQEAIQKARRFFRRYFPAFDFKAFLCTSWLLDPSLDCVLPAGANILRFQSLFQLFPCVNGNDRQTRERVFGDPALPLDQVPQRTSLQRNTKKAILEGHRFRGSGGVIL